MSPLSVLSLFLGRKKFKIFILHCLKRGLFSLRNVLYLFRASCSQFTTNGYSKMTNRLSFEVTAAELKKKIHINLNPCHMNEWDNYNYKNLMFRLK